MEISVLAERIIHDINVALCREPDMDEFDIIPALDSHNKSPVVHIGTKMALESWCVKFLYVHVYTRIMEWREGRLKADDGCVAQWSELLVMLNPDVSTGWNIRKELLTGDRLLEKHELRLSKLVLTRKPKSPEVFIHRRWLISRLLQSESWNFSSTVSKEKLVAGDLELCTIAATRYSNNYCAWCHREWIHDNVTLKYLSFRVFLDELKFSENYVQRNVSDHSGLQFRQYLLRVMTNNADHKTTKFGNSKFGQFDYVGRSNSQSNPISNCCAQTNCQISICDDGAVGLLQLELVFVRKLIRNFPGHEALWCHNRFVLHLLCDSQRTRSVSSKDEKLEIAEQKMTSLNGPQIKKTRTESCDNKPLPTPIDEVFPASKGSNISVIQDELNFLAEMQSDDIQSRLATNHKHWLGLAIDL